MMKDWMIDMNFPNVNDESDEGQPYIPHQIDDADTKLLMWKLAEIDTYSALQEKNYVRSENFPQGVLKALKKMVWDDWGTWITQIKMLTCEHGAQTDVSKWMRGRECSGVLISMKGSGCISQYTDSEKK